MKRRILAAAIALLAIGAARRQSDLAIPAPPHRTQVTIYNEPDIALVRETRMLKLKQGQNRVRLSWGKTPIDPTSLELALPKDAHTVDISGLTYPPTAPNRAVWRLESSRSARLPVDISYLIQGLDFKTLYVATLSDDEQTVDLDAYVRITNNTRQNYTNAQIRLLTGAVPMLDAIKNLAAADHPYGRPPADQLLPPRHDHKNPPEHPYDSHSLLTLEGTQSIPSGWSKRFGIFHCRDLPAVNIYRCEQHKSAPQTVRFLVLKDTGPDILGDKNLPPGPVTIYKNAPNNSLAFISRTDLHRTRPGRPIELNLGPATDVRVRVTLTNLSTTGHTFDRTRNLSGYNQIRQFHVEAKNTRKLPVRVQVRRTFDTPYWAVHQHDDHAHLRKLDADTADFTLTLPPQSTRKFAYTLTTCHGTNQTYWQDPTPSRAPAPPPNRRAPRAISPRHASPPAPPEPPPA